MLFVIARLATGYYDGYLLILGLCEIYLTLFPNPFA